MKTLVINIDDSASEKLLKQIAKKFHLKVRVLSDNKKEDAGLLAMMEERKNETTIPVSKTYEILRKAR